MLLKQVISRLDEITAWNQDRMMWTEKPYVIQNVSLRRFTPGLFFVGHLSQISQRVLWQRFQPCGYGLYDALYDFYKRRIEPVLVDF